MGTKQEQVICALKEGRTSLGIELGSTRIKAVLLSEDYTPIASADYTWENRYEDGYWTYPLEEVWTGLQACYRGVCNDVKEKYDVSMTTVGAMGISAMMHGYLPFDASGNLLVPFRTWRNTTTGVASEKLTELLKFNIPQRWSVSHLYQAMLNKEPHVGQIAHLTTLAGYVHWKLTNNKILGVGDASGMFPIDSSVSTYNEDMLAQFEQLSKDYPWELKDLLPNVASAGENAGTLTEEGALLLDPSGILKPGIPFCPPEGDAGTGMVATNAVAARTGNVSAGTSIFSMIVLEKMLSQVYPEIDMVTTPTGRPVAMVHCNNCTSDINAWASLFHELLNLMGVEASEGDLFTKMYQKSLEGAPDCGDVTVYNYLSGEPVSGFDEGRPLVVRSAKQPFTLANFLRAQLYSTLATLKIGMDILAQENVSIDRLMGHGGLFKTPVVGQKYLAAATESPVWVMETAGEGGPYGMALLAAYMYSGRDTNGLEEFLEKKVFEGTPGSVIEPDETDIEGFSIFMERYRKGLAVERAAVQHL